MTVEELISELSRLSMSSSRSVFVECPSDEHDDVFSILLVNKVHVRELDDEKIVTLSVEG